MGKYWCGFFCDDCKLIVTAEKEEEKNKKLRLKNLGSELSDSSSDGSFLISDSEAPDVSSDVASKYSGYAGFDGNFSHCVGKKKN